MTRKLNLRVPSRGVSYVGLVKTVSRPILFLASICIRNNEESLDRMAPHNHHTYLSLERDDYMTETPANVLNDKLPISELQLIIENLY
jgi:hypothetical protein